MVKVTNNLIDKIFGRLTVIKQGEDYICPNGKHVAQWYCKCSCGNQDLKLIRGSSLTSGKTKSCGCLSKENGIKQGKKFKKYNKYDLSGEYGIGYTNKNEEFWFDIEDYDKIRNYCWYYNSNGYVCSQDEEHKHIYLHRLIIGVTDPMIVIDNIKHPANKEHKVDNRKSNLRKVTQVENNRNKHKQINNISGTSGVYYDNKNKKWVAQISLNNRTKYVGQSNDIQDAIDIRKEAEQKYYQEYAFNINN